MNKRGHPETLVAAQPGNRNAAKAGVFSPGMLADRAREIHGTIEAKPHAEVIEEVLRREVAAMVAYGEAMDRALDGEGVIGRRGEPRTLVSLRLRLNEKLVRTLDRYDEVVRRRATGDGGNAVSQDPSEVESSLSLPAGIASAHGRDSIEEVRPCDLDGELFLRAVILNRSVRERDKLRALKLLMRRRSTRPELCVCSSTLVAHDAIQFRQWIAGARGAGLEPHKDDQAVAAVVRKLAAGERLESSWALYRKTSEALERVIAEAVADPEQQDEEWDSLENDPVVKPFWQRLLSPDEKVSAKVRLDCFDALDELGAIRRCTCERGERGQLPELRADELRAYVIQVVVQAHYRAALAVAQFPQTYLAVRDAIDTRVLAATNADQAPDVSAS